MGEGQGHTAFIQLRSRDLKSQVIRHRIGRQADAHEVEVSVLRHQGGVSRTVDVDPPGGHQMVCRGLQGLSIQIPTGPLEGVHGIAGHLLKS